MGVLAHGGIGCRQMKRVAINRGFAFAPMLVPRQSFNHVRSQNSIWRGGFHRCEYREAMRIRPADCRQSGIF
jgi:hypothetical protein